MYKGYESVSEIWGRAEDERTLDMLRPEFLAAALIVDDDANRRLYSSRAVYEEEKGMPQCYAPRIQTSSE